MGTSVIERHSGGLPPAGAPPPGEPFQRCLTSLSEALAEVVEVPAWSLTEEELVDRITVALRVRAGVDELVVRLVGSALERDLARLAGATSATAWLTHTLHVSRRCAGELVGHAKAFSGRVEATRRAWAAGRVSSEQARVIAEAIDRVGCDVAASAVARAEAHLIELAPQYSYDELRHLASHLVEVVDPVGAEAKLGASLEAEERRAWEGTVFRASRGVDGLGSFNGKMPNVQLDMLTTVLEAIAAPRRADAVSPVFDLDGAGTDPASGPLTYAQRMGQAFVELIEHLPTDRLPQHGVANASIVVTMSLEQLQSGLGDASSDTGTPLSASQTRRLACNAALIPSVLGGRSRILDHGLARRLYDRHQRIALTVRDQGCVFPGCSRSPSWTEAHHIRPWSKGGPTDLDNGCLLCGYHHRLIHQGEWEVSMVADGFPSITPPARIDPARRPLRHARFRSRPQYLPLRT